MKTKVVFKNETIFVSLETDPETLALIVVEYQGPAKEIVQKNKPKFVDVFPTIQKIQVSENAFKYKGDLLEMSYTHFFKINNAISEIVKDFKRIKTDEYLEILDAVEMTYPAVSEQSQDILVPEISKPKFGIGKINTWKDKLFTAFKAKENEFTDKEKKLMNAGFNVINELLKEIEKDNRKKLK